MYVITETSTSCLSLVLPPSLLGRNHATISFAISSVQHHTLFHSHQLVSPPHTARRNHATISFAISSVQHHTLFHSPQLTGVHSLFKFCSSRHLKSKYSVHRSHCDSNSLFLFSPFSPPTTPGSQSPCWCLRRRCRKKW